MKTSSGIVGLALGATTVFNQGCVMDQLLGEDCGAYEADVELLQEKWTEAQTEANAKLETCSGDIQNAINACVSAGEDEITCQQEHPLDPCLQAWVDEVNAPTLDECQAKTYEVSAEGDIVPSLDDTDGDGVSNYKEMKGGKTSPCSITTFDANQENKDGGHCIDDRKLQ